MLSDLRNLPPRGNFGEKGEFQMFECFDCEESLPAEKLLVVEHDEEVLILCQPCDDQRRGPENPREWEM